MSSLYLPNLIKLSERLIESAQNTKIASTTLSVTSAAVTCAGNITACVPSQSNAKIEHIVQVWPEGYYSCTCQFFLNRSPSDRQSFPCRHAFVTMKRFVNKFSGDNK